MITAMVRNKLLNTSAVTAMVSTRIYVDEQPVPATLPSITIHPVSGVPDKKVSKGAVARVQVSCWASPGKPRNPVSVEAVAAAVKAALHLPRMNNSVRRWTIGSVSYDIITGYVTGGVRLIDPTTDWYHVPLDVEITYMEV